MYRLSHTTAYTVSYSLEFEQVSWTRVQYERATSVYSGHVIWANEIFECGLFNDLSNFKLDWKTIWSLVKCLLQIEVYSTSRHIILTQIKDEYKCWMKDFASRETSNQRLKHFNVLSHTFWHSIQLHSTVFYVVLNLVHLMVSTSNTLFEFQF